MLTAAGGISRSTEGAQYMGHWADLSCISFQKLSMIQLLQIELSDLKSFCGWYVTPKRLGCNEMLEMGHIPSRARNGQILTARQGARYSYCCTSLESLTGVVGWSNKSQRADWSQMAFPCKVRGSGKCRF